MRSGYHHIIKWRNCDRYTAVFVLHRTHLPVYNRIYCDSTVRTQCYGSHNISSYCSFLSDSSIIYMTIGWFALYHSLLGVALNLIDNCYPYRVVLFHEIKTTRYCPITIVNRLDYWLHSWITVSFYMLCYRNFMLGYKYDLKANDRNACEQAIWSCRSCSRNSGSVADV